MSHLLIFGLGYSAARIAAAMKARGWQVTATGSAGDIAFADHPGVLAALGEASHILSSVPPDRATGGDPVLDAYGAALAGKPLFYLSSTGVYGDKQGAWVDEATPTIAQSGEGRRNVRAEADLAWLTMGARVFRLPGIYGPGRSALDRVRAGQARRIDLPDQVFSRVHVDDITLHERLIEQTQQLHQEMTMRTEITYTESTYTEITVDGQTQIEITSKIRREFPLE